MTTYADALIEGQKLHARKPADFYPSPPDVTQALIDFLNLKPGTFVWEPACGDGAMSKVLSASGCNVHSTDLREDSGYGEGGVDFLTADPEGVAPDWIITNPPFKLAPEFITRSLQITPNAAMLLKSQFWHAARRLELFEKHPPSHILALTWRPAFLEAERGSSPLMDVIWCVWQKNSEGTRFTPVRRPKTKFQGRGVKMSHDVDSLIYDDYDPLVDLLG
jgi:hypothetical protein